MEGTQSDIVTFLSDPASYGADHVEVIETHISLVFLAGDYAYKLKRAITLPYVDFSTLESRRKVCQRELDLNRRTAPELYLATRAIARDAGGRINWSTDGSDDIVDWVVVMRRFPEEARLDIVMRREALPAALLYRLAAHIADFHAAAEVQPSLGGAAAMEALVRENDVCLRALGGAIFPASEVDTLRASSMDALHRLAPLLDRRRGEGKVRRCHGDLHLRNIYVVDGVPKLFDCLEFSDELACIDVLYDLAFLLMDLWHQHHEQGANLVLNRYLDLTDEAEGLAALPLFIALRAAIRAHVTAVSITEGHADGKADAQSYLSDALGALRPAAPRLIAIGGLSGTGKSTLAASLAPTLGVPPGARVLRSDVIRKRLFGLAPEAPLPANAYTDEVTARVYEALRNGAASALHSGTCAIIDAVALRPEERTSFAKVAEAAGARFDGLWLEASREALLQRVAARRHDASDADANVVSHQLVEDAGVLDWRRIDASGRPTDTHYKVRKALRI